MKMENMNREMLNFTWFCQATELTQVAEVIFNTADDEIVCFFDM